MRFISKILSNFFFRKNLLLTQNKSKISTQHLKKNEKNDEKQRIEKLKITYK